MATGRISKSTVDASRAGPKDLLLWDDKLKGFGLKVTPGDSKVYVIQYRLGGRGAPVRRFTIGKHGTLTPDGARTVFHNAEEVSQWLITEKLISTVPWDEAGAYLRFSVTFVARDPADELRVLQSVAQRLGDVTLEF